LLALGRGDRRLLGGCRLLGLIYCAHVAVPPSSWLTCKLLHPVAFGAHFHAVTASAALLRRGNLRMNFFSVMAASSTVGAIAAIWANAQTVWNSLQHSW